jgi:hypothetical protein
MLIGVCFFGRIKHFDKNYFVNSFGPEHKYNFFYSGDNEPEDLLVEFKKMYNPICVNNTKISYNIDFGIYPNKITYPVNIHNMTCHLLNKKRVFGLLEDYCNITNTSYDLIVSCRLDLYIEQYSPEKPLVNTIYIPAGEDHMGINDRLAYGDFQTMKKYMNLYDNCVYLLDRKLSLPHPESLHLATILFYKLNIIRFSVRHEIIR